MNRLLRHGLLALVLAMLTGPALADDFRGVVTGTDVERQLVSIDGRDYRISADTEMAHEHDPDAMVATRSLKPGTRVRYRTAPATSGQRPMLTELVVIDRE